MAERFGDRIRRIRKARKLGLRATAAKVGISATYLSRIETMAERSPPAETVIHALAEELDDDFDLLMQLADRIPEDVKNFITSDPKMPEALRIAQRKNITGEDIMEFLKHKRGKKK